MTGSPKAPSPQQQRYSKLRTLLTVVVSVAAASLLLFLVGVSMPQPPIPPSAALDPILRSQDARKLLDSLRAMDSMEAADISGVSSEQRRLERQLIALTSRMQTGFQSLPAGADDTSRGAMTSPEAGEEVEPGGPLSGRYAVCQSALRTCRTNLDRAEQKKVDLTEQLARAGASRASDAAGSEQSSEVVSKLREEIARLEKEVVRLQAQSETKCERSTESGTSTTSGAEVDKLRAEVEKLQVENADLKKEAGTGAGLAQEAEAKLRGKEEEVGQLRAQVKDLEEVNSKLKGRTSERQEGSKITSLKEEIEDLRAEVQGLKKKNAALSKAARKHQDEDADSAKGAESKLKAEEDRAARLQAELDQSKAELKKLRQQNSDLKEQSRGGTATDGSAEQSGEVERLRRKVQELQERSGLALLGAGGDPGAAQESGNRALEVAAKTLEECGRKQGLPPKPVPASKLTQCEATEEELKQYLNYKPREQCPDDWYTTQKLIFLKNCYALPPRRCFSPMPAKYAEPSIPFPKSLFDQRVLQNANVRWTKQYWPDYEAINNRTWGDCRDCFNLTRESWRWQVEFYGTPPIDYVLSLKPKGSIKIGLDAGGGTGSFAAKMAERGVTIVTTAMNTETLGDKEGGLPYMETIAQRGLIPFYIPHRARQPFFDGTLDIIHNINSVKYLTIPEFEELMFEWDRILRPGGVMWFELFYAPVAEMPLYIAVLDLLGYKKLYWNLTPKEDAAERKHMGLHVYLNAVLEKPRRKDRPPQI